VIHKIAVTARRFKYFSWPSKTEEWFKETTCSEAEAFANQLRRLGALVEVSHDEHAGERA
jgi:hypothetical protein